MIFVLKAIPFECYQEIYLLRYDGKPFKLYFEYTHYIENDHIELTELNCMILGYVTIYDIRLFSALFLSILLTYLHILACSQGTIFNHVFVLLRTCVNYIGNTSLPYSFIKISCCD